MYKILDGAIYHTLRLDGIAYHILWLDGISHGSIGEEKYFPLYPSGFLDDASL